MNKMTIKLFFTLAFLFSMIGCSSIGNHNEADNQNNDGSIYMEGSYWGTDYWFHSNDNLMNSRDAMRQFMDQYTLEEIHQLDGIGEAEEVIKELGNSGNVIEECHNATYTTETRIPQELIDFLSEEVSRGMDAATADMEAMTSHVELTAEEVEVYGAVDKTAALFLMDYYAYNDEMPKVYRIDGDNDGIEDLYFTRSNCRYFLQGQEDGSFLFTDVQYVHYPYPVFINYEGNNYLVEPVYDMTAVGLLVTCFENGRISEWGTITGQAVSYEPELLYMADGYEGQEEQWTTEGILPPWEMYTGSAETMTGEDDENHWVTHFTGDIDNDGIEEEYSKYLYEDYYSGSVDVIDRIRYCKIMDDNGLIDSLEICHGLDSGDRIIGAKPEDSLEGTTQMIWLERAENGKNILYFRTYDGEAYSYLYGYVFEDGNAELVLKVLYHGVQEITVERSTARRNQLG